MTPTPQASGPFPGALAVSRRVLRGLVVLNGAYGLGILVLLVASLVAEDWVMSADRKRLYVSLPDVNQLAVIDLATWKVIANIDVGDKKGAFGERGVLTPCELQRNRG